VQGVFNRSNRVVPELFMRELQLLRTADTLTCINRRSVTGSAAI
jgi:hypothetical protein